MKLSEFKEQLKLLGFEVTELGANYVIKAEGESFGTVCKEIEFAYSTNYAAFRENTSPFDRQHLVSVISEFSATRVDDRKDTYYYEIRSKMTGQRLGVDWEGNLKFNVPGPVKGFSEDYIKKYGIDLDDPSLEVIEHVAN